MLPITIRSPPALGDYVPLVEYQSATPETFHGGKPVLHYHAAGARARIPKSELGRLPIFPADATSTAPDDGVVDESSDEVVEQKVDLFVNSQHLTIFNPATESGVSIPYPTISIHAIKHVNTASDAAVPAVYMQLELSDGGSDDDTFDTLELTLFPPKTASPSADVAVATAAATPSETSRLFDAISECSNLHPDPAEPGGSDDDDDDDDDRIVFEGDRDAVEGFEGVWRGAADGGLPPPLPGSSGWITAENVHEFFDAEGNWIGGEEEKEEGVSGELGEGAGRVRARDEVEGQQGGVNGQGQTVGEDAESKRARTE